MPRAYRVTFENVLVSGWTATADLINITGAAGKLFRVLRHNIGVTDNTLATGQGLQLRSRFLPATVTVGSGGSVQTPTLNDPGDAAASITARKSDTTPATTSGTAIILYENGCHLYQGDNWRYDNPPWIGPSEAFQFQIMNTAYQGTVHLSGMVEVEEIGG